MVWTMVEPCAGIISGCLPILRPILTALMDRTGFTRLISSKGGKKSGPSDIVTIGGGGQGRERSHKNNAALTDSKTSLQRLRDEPELLQHGTAGLYPNGYKSTWHTDVEGGWRTAEEWRTDIPMHSIQVRTDMEMSKHEPTR